MKVSRIIIAAVISIAALGMPLAASAKASTVTHPSYCGAGAYNAYYRSVYAYPTGSYWQGQIAAYPDYYAANNAYYQATFGC